MSTFTTIGFYESPEKNPYLIVLQFVLENQIINIELEQFNINGDSQTLIDLIESWKDAQSSNNIAIKIYRIDNKFNDTVVYKVKFFKN